MPAHRAPAGLLLLALASGLALAPRLALAHGGQPQVLRVDFAPQFPGQAFATTDNQGPYIGDPQAGFRWLCEDAIAANAGVRFVAPIGPGQTHWLVGTQEGLFETRNRGCDFARTAGALADQRAVAVSLNPADPAEVLVATDGFGQPNDVFRSVDAGASWTPAGLAVPDRMTGMLRSQANPAVVYVAHALGAARSDDFGQHFAPIKLGPAGLDVVPEEFVLLAAPPGGGGGRVFAAAERIGGTHLLRSDDGGESWVSAAVIDDLPLDLVFDATGQRGLVVTPFAGARRSEDGGATWAPAPLPVERLGCLIREPGGDRLWGCTNVFFGGPWAVGFSDDHGRTWQPALAQFQDVVGRWPCARESQGKACCQHLCPGVGPTGRCDDQAAAVGEACADPLQPDGGPADGAVADAGVADSGPALDGGVRPDRGLDLGVRDAEPHEAGTRDAGDPEPDAAPVAPPAAGGGAGGCRHSPRTPGTLAPIALALLGIGRRQGRRR